MDDCIFELTEKLEYKETTLRAVQTICARSDTQYNQANQAKVKLQEEVEELQKKLAQMSVAQEVQQPLALPAPVEPEAPAEEEEEEEDPEEREFCNSSDEDAGSEESTASSIFPPKKRLKASEYAKLFKTQH